MTHRVFIPIKHRGEIVVAKMDHDEWLKISSKKIFAQTTKEGNTYACIYTDCKKQVLLHRYIMKPAKGMVVDHKNTKTLDNTISNLRVCTYSQNNMNRTKRKDTKGKFKGVCKVNSCKSKYTAAIKGRYIGIFDNPIDAALAYNKEAIKIYGEFAKLNNITREV